MRQTVDIVDVVNRPLYTYSEADYLADVSRGTSKRWLAGYEYRNRRGSRVRKPPVTRRTHLDAAVSFVDLLEVAAIGRLKAFGFSLGQIRSIVDNCQRILDVPRPLTTLRFKIGGREIFVERHDDLLEVGRRRGMQAWKQVLQPFLDDLEYAQEVAHRWWPLGRSNPIVIDPEYAYGLPVIANSGIRTEIVLERFQAGDLDERIADDFNVSTIEVQRALQFELKRAA